MTLKMPSILTITFFTTNLILAVFNILVYLAMRPFWYFIDRDVKTPLTFTILLFSMYTIYAVYSIVLFILLINKKTKLINPLTSFHKVLPIIFGVLLSVFSIYLFTRMEGSQYLVTTYIKSPTPYLSIVILLFILVFFSPNLKISQRPVFYYAGIAIGIIILILKTMDFGNVKITSGPNVQIVDDNSIAILWTTNKNSTAFVEYGTDKEHLQKAFMSTDGLIDANTKYHKVIVPTSKQHSIVYRISSTKINHNFQNNVNYGNTVVSDFKKYNDGSLKDNIVFYTLDDIHENKNIYNKFLAKDDYDFLVLNGDTVNTIDNTSDIIKKVLKPLSTATNGSKPFFLVRGNHEPRGAEARELPNYLALPNNKYYYTFNYGPIFAIVLDSGEDKLDNHPEYSGLDDFENYRSMQSEWLKTIAESDDYKNSKYKIAFVHIPLNMDDSNQNTSSLNIYEKNWRELLNKMKIDVAFSGHTHIPMVIQPDNNNFTFPTIIGGGPTDNEKEYMAIKTEVTYTEMKISFVSFDGKVTQVYSKTKP